MKTTEAQMFLEQFKDTLDAINAAEGIRKILLSADYRNYVLNAANAARNVEIEEDDENETTTVIFNDDSRIVIDEVEIIAYNN